jgi:hypothetical protein
MGLDWLLKLPGCEEEISEIYHRLCCRQFRSPVTILSYPGSLFSHRNSSLNYPFISELSHHLRNIPLSQNCPYTRISELSPHLNLQGGMKQLRWDFLSHIIKLFQIPKYGTKIDKARMNDPHNVRQYTDQWVPPEATHNLCHKVRQAESEKPLPGGRKSQKIKTRDYVTVTLKK